jgi:hypothetical protein
MAAQIAHDVVKEVQSVGAQSLTGDIATSQTLAPADSGLPNQPQSNVNEAAVTKANQGSDDDLQIVDAGINGPSRELARSPFSKEALADASGGSDTDTSKPDGLAGKDGVSGHTRTNSVKKPTTFKSVSVTKNFLAKTNVPAALPGQKGMLHSHLLVWNTGANKYKSFFNWSIISSKFSSQTQISCKICAWWLEREIKSSKWNWVCKWSRC